MKTSGFSRVWFFVILFAVIVTAHIVILRLVVKDGKVEEPRPEQTVSAAPAAPATAPATPAAAPAPEKIAEVPAAAKNAKPEEKPGFFQRLFGKKEQKPAVAAVAPPPEEKAPVAAPPRVRNRKPSQNPHFGEPLDFSKSLHGNMVARLTPNAEKWSGTGIIVDMDTRKVLWEKDSSRPVPVASMVKMMTMLLVAEELERSSTLTLDTIVPVTRTVMQVKRTGILWLQPGEKFTLRELMLGVAVKSANDAATLVAEHVGGDIDVFVKRMNQRAAELKLPSLKFHNPCGLPDRRGRNALGSAADMVMLGERLLEYPFLIEMCSTLKGSIRDGKTIFVNTNRLINPHYPGVDGLKTGFINASGFCLTFSVLRDNRRIMGCVTGFKSPRDRDRFCRRLIDWAYDPDSISRPKKAVTKRRSQPARRKGSGRAPARKR